MSSSGEGQNNNDTNQPRQPRNFQDLVRYSIEAGGADESSDVHDHLSPERRRFLEEALKSLTEDVTKELAEAITVLKSYRYSVDDNSTYVCALDIIAERVDNIDCANDFCKLGGFDIVINCLSSPSEDIRWRICDIVAQCAQNNTYCQEFAIKFKFLKPLLNTTDKDPNDKCKTKAFFAIASIVRDYPLGLQEFMKLDGFSVVLRAMQSDIERLRNKSTFFLSSILSQHPEIIGEVYNMGFVEQLVALIQREHSPIHEHVISTLLIITKNYEPAQVECRRPELELRSSLKSLLEQHLTDDAFREEMGYIKQLLALVFPDGSEEER